MGPGASASAQDDTKSWMWNTSDFFSPRPSCRWLQVCISGVYSWFRRLTSFIGMFRNPTHTIDIAALLCQLFTSELLLSTTSLGSSMELSFSYCVYHCVKNWAVFFAQTLLPYCQNCKLLDLQPTHVSEQHETDLKVLNKTCLLLVLCKMC